MRTGTPRVFGEITSVKVAVFFRSKNTKVNLISTEKGDGSQPLKKSAGLLPARPDEDPEVPLILDFTAVVRVTRRLYVT